MSKSTIFSEACNKVIGFEQMGIKPGFCKCCGGKMATQQQLIIPGLPGLNLQFGLPGLTPKN